MTQDTKFAGYLLISSEDGHFEVHRPLKTGKHEHIATIGLDYIGVSDHFKRVQKCGSTLRLVRKDPLCVDCRESFYADDLKDGLCVECEKKRKEQEGV